MTSATHHQDEFGNHQFTVGEFDNQNDGFHHVHHVTTESGNVFTVLVTVFAPLSDHYNGNALAVAQGVVNENF